MENDGAAKPTLIGSVVRALELVDAIGASSRPLPAKHLARALGLSLGTTYNLLRTLVHEGYVAQEPDGFVLGAGHPSQSAAQPGARLARVRAALTGLRNELNAAAYLSCFEDGEIDILDIVDGPRAPRVDLWVGVQESAHATAFGKQILAALPLSGRKDYLDRHPPVQLTPFTVHTTRELERRASLSPAVSVEEQEYSLGHRCIAVPVLARGFTGSLAVSIPADSRTSPAVLAGSLTRHAQSLALHLGA
ncbi:MULTISPECIES: helix-turn-helix domain-containing protein [Arthrobacter]|uniref:Helix-turn-helix domain-containing protein n=2 Tax=Arthrobacter TaxID=1663 RepID=A0ABU9KLB2_9MICC|nr:helix-turn-helix domain-containing protein [Arthrobacter sp. YJM1]MDP5227696.1 helix-turn-helix domain-containing protein [Arthrobacter sp. YJM1]